MKYLKTYKKLKEDKSLVDVKHGNKLNSPTFAFLTVYGKYPDIPIRGRSQSPKKYYNGEYVDKNIKNEWLDRLNSLPVEIRSTEEGKDEIRISHVAFRLPIEIETKENVKKIVDNLNKYDDVYSSYNIGKNNRFRIMVAGKIWIDKSNWGNWWENIDKIIYNSYLSIKN